MLHHAEIVVIYDDVDIEARAIVIELNQIGVVQLFCDLTKCQPYQLSVACLDGFLSITEIIITCPTIGITEIIGEYLQKNQFVNICRNHW